MLLVHISLGWALWDAALDWVREALHPVMLIHVFSQPFNHFSYFFLIYFYINDGFKIA